MSGFVNCRGLSAACFVLLALLFGKCFAEEPAPDVAFQKHFTDPLLADGFDFPVGDADGRGKFRVASKFANSGENGVQAGESWAGAGPVFASANGRVIYAQDGVVAVEHQFFENGKLRTVISRYGQLDEVLVTKDHPVKRRAKLGTFGKNASPLQFEIRKTSAADFAPESAEERTAEQVRANYEAPTAFIKERRKLLHPATMPELLLVVKHRYQLHRFENGAKTETFEIALSQAPVGHKLAEGDLRLPEGEYRIVQKAKGPFAGKSWMKYLGAAWLRIDYPNASDAAVALAEMRISQSVHDAIVRANRARKMPPQDSALGGGIGIHGWKEPGWNPDGDRHITWGCISLNKDDLLKLSAKTEVGTPVVIMP